ncbi:MAG TPA: hypothetical protein VEA60_05860, partial [Allosphingosinicella sp.]|nr:hypothetical protein [Allosphingosinicella sp.]
MSVAADEAPDEPVLIPVVADGTDQSALINLMLATSTASVLELPPGDYWIGSNIYIPEGKTLVGAGQGLTTLHFLATFDAHVDNRAIVLGDRAGLSDLTVNGEKVGLGLSSAERICGVIGAGVDFLVERVSVVNTTGYAFWAFGNNDTTRPPASGVFRDCYAENANVLFETSDADGVLFERCVGADGDGDIAVASAFHPAAGSQNVSFVDCEYEGAGPVIDVLANLGDQAGILFQNVRGTTTGPADAVYIVGDGRSQVTIVDSSIVALQGYALFVQNSDLLAVRSSFETPRIGAWFDRNSTGYFAGSEISAIAAPGSLGLNYAIFTEGSVLWEGGEISV